MRADRLPSHPNHRPAFFKRRIGRDLTLAGFALIALVASACEAGANIVMEGTASAAPPSVTLALLGDVMLGRSVHPSAETFLYLEPYLRSADLALANLESPLTGQPVQTASPYALCAPPENVKFLAQAGFDLLSLANNHILDCGLDGLAETQSTLAEANLGYLGPDPTPAFREVNGIRLAFLAFDATSDFQLQSAVQAVQSARQAAALVIVSIHWGAEYQSGESDYQEQIASQLAGAGAALIWGHHPHVLQPAQWLDGRQTLVLYSLGNALFDQYGLETTRRSALAWVKLNQQGVQGLQAVPFLIDVRHSRIVEADAASAQTVSAYFK